ncbi:hypothetical protein T484DRAFT_1877482 [Baffinella frigidus]|nr:hypothetical protein T484DRAFT_1877482 [Cryptophyta sp. CCMP2293]
MAAGNLAKKITSGRERFAIALMDAIEAMLDRGFLHKPSTTRGRPTADFGLMGTIAEALVHLLDMRSLLSSRAGQRDNKVTLNVFNNAPKNRWFVKKVLRALDLLQKLLDHSTEQVISRFVEAWERVVESRFACPDFDAATALLLQEARSPTVSTGRGSVPSLRDFAQHPDLWLSSPPWSEEEVELDSIRKMLVCAADSGYSMWHNA